MGEAEGRGLRHIGDGCPEVRAIADRRLHLIGGVADDDADLGDPGRDELLDRVEEDRLVGDRHELLGSGRGQWPQPQPLPPSANRARYSLPRRDHRTSRAHHFQIAKDRALLPPSGPGTIVIVTDSRPGAELEFGPAFLWRNFGNPARVTPKFSSLKHPFETRSRGVPVRFSSRGRSDPHACVVASWLGALGIVHRTVDAAGGLGWLAIVVTNSPGLRSSSPFAGLPFLAVAPFGGALIDRVDRRSLMLTCQLLAFLPASGVLAADVMSGFMQPWHLPIAPFLNGHLQALLIPTQQSLVPTLVPRESLHQRRSV